MGSKNSQVVINVRLAAKRQKVQEDEVKVEVNPLPPFESIEEPLSPFEELEKFLQKYDGGYEVDACLNVDDLLN